jgi:Xaa-Pro aminopeptidase
MPTRIRKLQNMMAATKLDGFIVSGPTNVRYLSGYTGSNGMMLITRNSAWFYTDFRYKEQIRTEVRGCHKRVLARDLYAGFPVEQAKGLRRIGVEEGQISLARFRLVRKQLKKARLVPSRDLVLQIRRTKEPAEVEAIARSQAVTDRVYASVLRTIKPGVSERDLALEIESQFRESGEVAFGSIVASGPNAARPHAGFSDRKLRNGDVLTFDIGCRVAGYNSDMTRTVFVGKAKPELRRVYGIVYEAQRRALEAVRAGVRARAVDAAARDHIAAEGFGKQFGHSLGHGVGLDVHELPVLAARSEDTLAAGDVVTVEPGIYLPGAGGVRVEDMVLVTEDGIRNFTKSPKELVEL